MLIALFTGVKGRDVPRALFAMKISLMNGCMGFALTHELSWPEFMEVSFCRAKCPPPASSAAIAALFLENMDSTVIATSLPAIAADLGTDPIVLKLAFTTYLLSLTVFIPISGWCADRFGAKHVFRAAIVVFMLGSIACGFAQSLGWLIAARALQGLGGAMMVPVGRLIILREVPKSQLVDALAWLTIPALIGPLVGPPIGGFITTILTGADFLDEYSHRSSVSLWLRATCRRCRRNRCPLISAASAFGIRPLSLVFGYDHTATCCPSMGRFFIFWRGVPGVYAPCGHCNKPIPT
jgi:MFS family permease